MRSFLLLSHNYALNCKLTRYKKFVTAAVRPISTDANRTPKKAPMQARKSSLSSFQICLAALRLMSPGSAERIIDARIAVGV